MKSPFPDHRWTIPNPTRWRIERMTTKNLEDKLAEITAVRDSIQAARYQVALRIAAKERTVLDHWASAFAQQMRQHDAELNTLAKESARLERLVEKCAARVSFVEAELAESKM